MEYSEYKIGFYKRWQKHIVQLSWLIVSVLFVIEVVMAVAFSVSRTMVSPVHTYVLTRVIFPSAINFASVIIATLLLRMPGIPIEKKSYISSFLLVVVTAVISLFHNYFPIVFIAPTIAIFFCALLADKQLLYAVSFATFVVLAASIAEWVLCEKHGTAAYAIGTSFAAVMYNLCCFLAAKAILASQQDQIHFIYDGYVKQQQLINELRLEPLTRLYNRTALADVTAHCISQYRESDGLLMLALIDLDNFKNVNDHYGHASGDAVLIAFSSLLTRTLGGNRNAFRYGGDEFMILFKDKTLEEV